MNRKISQREARGLITENNRLKMFLRVQRQAWGQDWPESVATILVMKANEKSRASIETTRLLNHAVVVTIHGDNIYFHAVEIPKS